ncbi:hypothetical protein [Thalassotalea atypica]|uniref:hypothetical protein n=1 Tax=Thalassotalea atypica TaxID=2054316 RepID=UPI0025743FA6|nr:hypothetical protein [Thalassotalea atypica]
MFQGRITAVLFSIVIHVLLIFLIGNTIDNSPHNPQTKPKPIQSFLYQRPKIKEPDPANLKNELKPSKTIDKEVLIEQQPPENKPPKKSLLPQDASLAQQPADPLDAIRPPPNLQGKQVLTSKGIGQKALQQLSQLKSSINDDIAEAETFEQFRRRSPSVLDGEPYPVPHSVKALTIIEEKEKNTTKYSDDLSIIKGDDGNCTIEQDLSNVGIEGVKAVSGFRCGETKFDANFKEHMKNVLKKLGKK